MTADQSESHGSDDNKRAFIGKPKIRRLTASEKCKVILRVLAGGSVPDAATESGVAELTINGWVRRFVSAGTESLNATSMPPYELPPVLESVFLDEYLVRVWQDSEDENGRPSFTSVVWKDTSIGKIEVSRLSGLSRTAEAHLKMTVEILAVSAGGFLPYNRSVMPEDIDAASSALVAARYWVKLFAPHLRSRKSAEKTADSMENVRRSILCEFENRG